MVIAIDGNAGSGKTTISKIIAEKLSMMHVNTGAMYRAFTLYCIENNINADKCQNLVISSDKLNIEMNPNGEILLNGRDVTIDINTKSVTNKVSIFSAVPTIRTIMLDLQRKIVIGKDAVVEGRDIGTEVFPEAEVKFFFTADIMTRAKRRQKDFLECGENISIDTLVNDIKNRDFKDSNRNISPLKKAVDSIIVDTTNTTIDSQVNELIKIIKNKRKNLYGEF